MKNVVRSAVIGLASTTTLTSSIFIHDAIATSSAHRQEQRKGPFNVAGEVLCNSLFSGAAPKILEPDAVQLDTKNFDPAMKKAALAFNLYLQENDLAVLRKKALGNLSIGYLYLSELRGITRPKIQASDASHVTYAFHDEEDEAAVTTLLKKKQLRPLVLDLKSHLAVMAYREANKMTSDMVGGFSVNIAEALRKLALQDLLVLGTTQGCERAARDYATLLWEEIDQATKVLTSGKRVLNLTDERLDQLAGVASLQQVEELRMQRSELRNSQWTRDDLLLTVSTQAQDINALQPYFLRFFSGAAVDTDLKAKIVEKLCAQYSLSEEHLWGHLQAIWDPAHLFVTNVMRTFNDESIPVSERLSKVLVELPGDKAARIAVYKALVMLHFRRDYDAELGLADQVRDPSLAQKRFESMMEYLEEIKKIDLIDGSKLFDHYFVPIVESCIIHHDIMEELSEAFPEFQRLSYYEPTIDENGDIFFHGREICKKDGNPFFILNGVGDIKVLMAPSYLNKNWYQVELFGFDDSVKDYACNLDRMREFALEGEPYAQEWLLKYVENFEEVPTPLDALDIYAGLKSLSQKMRLILGMVNADRYVKE